MNLFLSDSLGVAYLVASVTFILGLKMLSKPDTARRGNSRCGYGYRYFCHHLSLYQ